MQIGYRRGVATAQARRQSPGRHTGNVSGRIQANAETLIHISPNVAGRGTAGTTRAAAPGLRRQLPSIRLDGASHPRIPIPHLRAYLFGLVHRILLA